MKNLIISIILSILYIDSLVQYSYALNIAVKEDTIDSIHYLIATKQITCKKLITEYLERIKNYNFSTSEKKPPVNAFSQINELAIEEAEYLDELYLKNGKLVGSLHCIPLALKDNIDVLGMTTSVGSLSLLENHPTQDSFVVSKLRKAGAIIIGQGAMDEFAFGVLGVSGRSGKVGNIYNTLKNSGGSSAGTAAAVGIGFAVVGIGTDTSGSIRIPSAFNGVIGLRPSMGLISQSGIFPMSNLDSVVGPIARTVADLATILDVIAQPDLKDKKTLRVPRFKSYKSYLNENGLRNKKIGIVRKVGNIDTFYLMPTEVVSIIENTLKKIKINGAKIKDNIVLTDFDTIHQDNESGSVQDINHYLESSVSPIRSFYDICASDATFVFGDLQECLKLIKSCPKKTSYQYKKALKKINDNKVYVQNKMKQYDVDVLLIPISTNGTSTYDTRTLNTSYAPISSNTGLPAITMNFGYTAKEHMPVGVEIIGRQFDEPTLIEIAFAYEKHFSPRVPPTLPKANLRLVKYSITEINNLITIIGKSSYNKILKKSNNSDDLTPEIFKNIVIEEINNYHKLR